MLDMKMKGLIVIILIIISTPATVGLNLDSIQSNELLQESTSTIIDPFEENITYWLKEVVRENDKQRFAFSPDETKIRATQGIQFL